MVMRKAGGESGVTKVPQSQLDFLTGVIEAVRQVGGRVEV